MNSSGIKRGLAATAISALAVTGLPSLATSADAAVGDSFTVVYTGPALNGGDEGALVIIRAKDGTIDPTLLDLTSTSSPNAGSEDTADQTADIVGVPTVTQDPSAAAFEFIEVRIAVTTTVTGDAASFRLFEDDASNNGVLEAGEARQTVSVSTAGALASIDVSPASQSSPENIESGAYTVTLKDAAGRTTQLLAGDQLDISHDGTVTINETGVDTDADDDTITSDEIVRGTDTFTAEGTTAGSYPILVEDAAAPAIEDTATLVVTEAANLGANEIDIVTGGDTWNGYGDGFDGGTTYVRVDENTVRFDFDAANSQAGANVQLTVDGFGGVTFAGQDQATYTTTLDANGNGSITVTADAATIQDGDGFDTDINGFDQQIVFERAVADSIDGAQSTYFCQDDGACTVTAVVLDQFGNPITTGEVEASRTGAQNVDATPQRKAVGPDGTVSFTFTDTNPVDGGTDTVLFEYFVDQFDNTADLSDNSTTIKYSATGQGSNYVISLDGNNTESGTYVPGDAAVIPLTDTDADTTAGPNDEDADITITGGEPNQAVTLSVNNGALILAPGDTLLSEGVSSIDATLTGAGALPAGYRIIGTTSGLVTLTVSSASRTETAQLTVSAQDDPDSARNVTLSGPATVPFGTNQITYTAVVTDAFGNPVEGAFDVFSKRVTGPAQYQDGDLQSDANGVLHFTVKVDPGGSGDVTLTIDAFDGNAQYGADADRLYSYSTTDDGEGLPASSDVASATTTVEAAVTPPPPAEKVNAGLVVRGRNNGAQDDKIVARALNLTAGATVRLFRKTVNGLDLLRTSTMNSKGNHKFENINDKNGRKYTKYVVKVEATDATRSGTGARRVR